MNKTKYLKCKLLIILLIVYMPMMSAEIVDINTDTIAVNEPVLKKNNVFFQIMGSSYICSFSYERTIFIKGTNHISLGIGYEYLGFNWSIITPQINYFTGSGKHHVIFGFGTAFPSYSSIMDYVTIIAYRFQKADGGLFFQAGGAYKFRINPMRMVSFLPALAIGYTF
jgi:hypothetical protein